MDPWEYSIKFGMPIHLKKLYLLNTILIIDIFGVGCVRSTMHTLIHKAELQSESDRALEHTAVSETLIQLDDKNIGCTSQSV